MKKLKLLLFPLLLVALNACSQGSSKNIKPASSEDTKVFPEAKSNAYWKSHLSAEAYEIMVNKGTEQPYHNPYYNNHAKGTYVSAATGKPIFTSATKFESGTGWPSFFQPINEKDIMIVKDTSFGTVREEVVERSTGLHLGHVFNDGPKPTGKRYCMNSYAFKFIPAK